MATEILSSWGPGETRFAVMRDGRLVDLVVARPELLAGAVVLGRVVEVAPRLGAVFVDIGQDRPAFLQGAKGGGRGGPTQGQTLLVQVKADAHGEKGATLSGEVTLPGRFLVYAPSRPGLILPRKLSDDRRAWLEERLRELVGEDEGVAARLHAVNADGEALADDLTRLRDRWAAIGAGRAGGRVPAVLWRPDPLERLLADHPGVARIVVDDDLSFAQAQARFGTLVERHRQGSLFAEHGIDDALAACLAADVALPCGGRVSIETTAALTAIDVDSGPAAAAEANQQAVTVIARQLRLRNIAGQMVVDFVSTGGRGALLRLVTALKQAVAGDGTPTHVLGITALGLVEMTRERRGPSLAELMSETRRDSSPAAAGFAALRRLLAEAGHRPGRAHALVLAPEVAAALRARPQALAEVEARLGRPPLLRSEPGRARDDIGIEEV